MKKTKKEKTLEQRIEEHFERGVEFSDDERFMDAADQFDQGLALARKKWATDAEALADGTDLTHWRVNLAAICQELQDWKRMLACMKEAMAQYPPDRDTGSDHTESSALCVLATAQQHTNDLAAALATIDRAIELDPEDADNHHERACILAWQGDVKGALAAMRRSIELDPDERPEKLRDDNDFKKLQGNDEFRKLVGLPPERL